MSKDIISSTGLINQYELTGRSVRDHYRQMLIDLGYVKLIPGTRTYEIIVDPPDTTDQIDKEWIDSQKLSMQDQLESAISYLTKVLSPTKIEQSFKDIVPQAISILEEVELGDREIYVPLPFHPSFKKRSHLLGRHRKFANAHRIVQILAKETGNDKLNQVSKMLASIEYEVPRAE